MNQFDKAPSYPDPRVGQSSGLTAATGPGQPGLRSLIAGAHDRMSVVLDEVIEMANEIEGRLLPVRVHTPETKGQIRPEPHTVFDYANALHAQCDRLVELRESLANTLGQL